MTANRVDQIGKQPPIEVFQTCLNLHGDMIKHVHKCSDSDYEQIVGNLKIFIEKNTDLLGDYLVADYKLLLNSKIKSGIQTIGKHKEIFSFLEKQAMEKKESDREKAKEESEEMKICIKCDLPKPLEEFRNVKGGKKSRICLKCNSEALKKGHENSSGARETKKSEETGKLTPGQKKVHEKHVKELQEKNEELSKRLFECENQKVKFMTEEEWLALQKTDRGLYFIAAILKDPDDNRMWHQTDQIFANSAEEAVGQFFLREDINNQIIISHSYEKSIHDKGSDDNESE